MLEFFPFSNEIMSTVFANQIFFSSYMFEFFYIPFRVLCCGKMQEKKIKRLKLSLNSLSFNVDFPLKQMYI